MPTMKILAAATLATALAAPPARAQDSMNTDARTTVKMKKMDRQTRMNDSARDTSTDSFDRRADYQRRDNDFWSASGPAVLTGAAIGAAGAIATAPFREPYVDTYAYDDTDTYRPGVTYRDSYAYAPRVTYDNGWNNNGWVGQSYAQRNGFVCTPGTWYTNDYGRTQLCQ